MSHTMTCWKEIARYLGKGVRTVQRWEHEMGLPVRRPHGRPKNPIFADSAELDAWMHSQFEAGGRFELTKLRNEIAALKKENELLRAELELAGPTPTFVRLEGSPDVENWMDDVLRSRCSHAVQRNNALRRESVHIVDTSRGMRALRKTQSEQNLKRFQSSLIH